MRFPNRKLALMLTALAATVLCSSMAGQTFNSTSGAAIPDSPAAGIENGITVSGVTTPNPQIRVTINITHTWDDDLDIFLLPPSVQWPGGAVTTATEAAAIAAGAIELATDCCGSGDNFTNTQFVFRGDNPFDATAAATVILAGTAAPATGQFQPEGFDKFGCATNFGVVNGSWRLAIVDDVGSDTGNLTSWSIQFAGATTAEAGIYHVPNPSSYPSSSQIPAGGTLTWPAAMTAATATSTGTAVFWTNFGATALTAGTGTVGTFVNCACTITTNVPASLAANSVVNLVFSVTPTAAGAFSFVFSVTNNDTGETPYTFTFAGTAVAAAAPEIQVERPGNGAIMIDGGADLLGNNPFGTPIVLTYTIRNIGYATLNITTPVAAPGALVNCTASISTQPAATVAAGATTTMGITVTPTAAGAFSCTWTFVNNDANENPFNMTISGTGVVAFGECDVTRGATPIADGGTDTVTGAVAGTGSVLTYTIANSAGAATSTTITTPVAAPGTLVNCTATITTQPTSPVAGGASTTMVITVTPTAAGAFSCTVTFANNDTNENPYNWTISGTAVSPECDVTRSGAVADGGTDTVTGAITGIASVLTYTITNSGTANLTITTPVAAPGGLTNCTATITTQPTSPVAPAGNTTLVVSVTPTAAGAFSCTITFANNDLNENPYNWTISGTAVTPAPEMDVDRGGAVADGGTDTVTGAAAGIASVLTYTINNTGTANLNITTLPVVAPAGLTNCTATITTQPTSPVAAAGNTTLVVSVTPTAAGAFSCTISIDNDDASENPYNWTISGTATGPVPEIGLDRGGAIADGGTDTVTGAFATIATTLTYTINNTGSANLTITTLPVAAPAGLVNCTASITTQPTSPVAPAGSTTIVISLTATAPGAFSCTVSIDNDDSNENPYNWTISGTAAAPAPEMDVLNGATAVADGALSDPLGNALFGIPQTVTYTINNTGNAALNLTGTPNLVVVTAGTNVTSATVTTNPATSVAAAGSTTFTITYTVTAAGAFNFTVSIANDDASENPYDWTADGTGISAPEMNVTRTAAVADGGTDTVTGAKEGSNTVLTYTIANAGNATLNITLPVTISGLTNCTATVTTAPAATVAAAGSTTVVITIKPSGSGTFSANVSITNDDTDENPYNWTITGSAAKKGGGGDEGGCSTGESNSLWMLAGVLASFALALRLRRKAA